jgi:hypothetical protein
LNFAHEWLWIRRNIYGRLHTRTRARAHTSWISVASGVGLSGCVYCMSMSIVYPLLWFHEFAILRWLTWESSVSVLSFALNLWKLLQKCTKCWSKLLMTTV